MTRRNRIGMTLLDAAFIPLVVVSLPLLGSQLRRVVRRKPRLPPASGDTSGQAAGDGPTLRLVVVGESTAAGVGADSHREALPGSLAEELSQRLRREVHWSAHGVNGGTARKIRDHAVPSAAKACPDVAVVTVGVNDLLRGASLRRWATDVGELITALRDSTGHTAVVLSGVPPTHYMPALPAPLRWVSGLRGIAMDWAARRVARSTGATHVPLRGAEVRSGLQFATDRFHPSNEGYRAWAVTLAPAVARSLTASAEPASDRSRP